MDPNNIQRHQYNTNPDSSYGAVFQLDTLVDVIPGLIYPAWLEVCARAALVSLQHVCVCGSCRRFSCCWLLLLLQSVQLLLLLLFVLFL